MLNSKYMNATAPKCANRISRTLILTTSAYGALAVCEVTAKRLGLGLNTKCDSLLIFTQHRLGPGNKPVTYTMYARAEGRFTRLEVSLPLDDAGPLSAATLERRLAGLIREIQQSFHRTAVYA